MNSRYKVMCGCECCISAKSMHSSLLTWRDRHLKDLKDRSNNEQNRRSGELSICILKSIRIMYDLMVVIFTIPLQTWPRKQCVPVILDIIGYRAGNMCYVVVIISQVFYYPFRRQRKIPQTSFQQ